MSSSRRLDADFVALGVGLTAKLPYTRSDVCGREPLCSGKAHEIRERRARWQGFCRRLDRTTTIDVAADLPPANWTVFG